MFLVPSNGFLKIPIGTKMLRKLALQGLKILYDHRQVFFGDHQYQWNSIELKDPYQE